jgi:hypothetical protein
LSPVFVLLSILWIDAITLKLIISRFHNVLTQNCWWNNTGLQEAKQKLGRCHLVKEASNTTQPLELLLWCFQFVLWVLTGGKYSTTIGNSFCTLSIGFFLVILVYDHSYWAYIPVVGKKKKKTYCKVYKIPCSGTSCRRKLKSFNWNLEICRKWFVLPCPQFELLIFGSSVLGGQDGVSEAMLVSKQAATLEVALISTYTLKPRLLQSNLGTWDDLWVHNSA